MKGMSSAVAKDIKAAAKVAKPKKANEPMPQRVVPVEIDLDIGEYLACVRNIEQTQALMEEKKTNIVNFFRGLQDEEAYLGTFNSSLHLIGADNQIKVVSQSRWSVDAKDGAALQGMVGKSLVGKIETLAVRKEFKDSDALVKLLIKKLGEDFSKHFQITEEWAVVKDFSQLLYKAVKVEDLPKLRLMAKQYSPSLKKVEE